MLRFDFQSYNLAFEYPFEISKGLKTHQPTLITFLAMGAQYGIGEATEISYYNNSIASMKELCAKHQSNITKYAFNGPERFWHYLHHLIPNQNFLISALDCASWDMWSKLRGEPLYKLLGIDWKEDIPRTDYTLGISSIEDLEQKIIAHPYPIYKLKMKDKLDLEKLLFLINHTNATIRIDANESWNWDTFESILPFLDEERIDCIEQPFSIYDKDSLIRYKKKCAIPVIGDEAFTDLKSVKESLLNYDGCNIKLSKCGGITPAIEIIKYVKDNGKKIMLGSMSESNVGAAALANLLPLADYVDIDGPLLLKENIGSPLNFDKQGNISFPENIGIGIQWKPL